MQVLAIASGKGGVGKSLIAANLSIALAQIGKKVIVGDLDLGGSNLHILLGYTGSTNGLGYYINNKSAELKDIVNPTSYENLSFLPGESELPGAANLTSAVKKRLLSDLLKLDADYLILDLGAGTGMTTMDLFLISGCSIIVTTPQLTATLNAYLFLKNTVFRVLNSSIKRNSPAYNYLEELKNDGVSLQKVHVAKLLENIKQIDPEVYDKFANKIKDVQPRLVLNMLDDPKDVSKSNRLKISSREYLGLEIEHLGVIYRDSMQNLALNSRLPIIIYKPKSVLSQAIFRLRDKVLDLPEGKPIPLDYEDADVSFDQAGVDAESDFSVKENSIEELLDSGALTQGDLLETIKMQQYEIKQIRKENRFLKDKIVKLSESGVKI